jgi:hypothetical protein
VSSADRIRAAAQELQDELAGYDPGSMRQMVRDLPALGAALGQVSQGVRAVADRAEQQWPTAGPVTEGLRSMAGDLQAAAQTAGVADAFGTHHGGDIERHDAPRGASRAVESRWDVGRADNDQSAGLHRAPATGEAPGRCHGIGTQQEVAPEGGGSGRHRAADTRQETTMTAGPPAPPSPGAPGRGTDGPGPAPAGDDAIDVGPGSLLPHGFPGPSVEWFEGNRTGGRTVRILDVDNDMDAQVELTPQEIRRLRDDLGRSRTDGTGGQLDAGDRGRVAWQPGPDGRSRVQITGADSRPATLTLTGAHLRALHTQLVADLADEDAARADFPGVTGRLQDKPRGQRYDVDAPLRLVAGDLTGAQVEASARALRLYRSGTYRAVAGYLRGTTDDGTILVRELPGDPGRVEQLAEHVALIDQAMAAAPLDEPATVWRGIREVADKLDVDLNRDLTGTEWTEKSFSSTSVDPNVASIFTSEDVLLRLHVPVGVGAVQLDSRPTTREHTREAEVLLERGLRMRVVGESHEPIGGGGTVWRDGKPVATPPTRYRVLEVEVSTPTSRGRASAES